MAITWGVLAEYEPTIVQRQNCCELPGGKFVVVYQEGLGAVGMAVVGSVADGVITFGAPSPFTVGQMWQTEVGVCPLGTDKFAVAYHDTGLGNDGYARVGVVTGTTIAWGAAVEFQNNNVWYPTCCQLDTDKFGIVYSDRDAWNGNVCICSVVGNVITAGVPVTFEPAGLGPTSCVSWATDKFVIAYAHRVDFTGNLRVVTCVGLVPTCHAAVQFEAPAGLPAQFTSGLAKVSADAFAISWRRGVGGADPSNAQCIRMGSVAGNVITLGSYHILNPFPEFTGFICVEALTTIPAQFIVLYPNEEAGLQLGYGTYNILDFTGITITAFGAKQFFKTSASDATTSANLLNGKLVVAFADGAAAQKGRALVGIFLTLPVVTTDAATNITGTTADINGTLDDDGGEVCDCGFEWGETVAYGNTTPTQSRETGQTFSQALDGLDPGTTYHFRAFATNAAGTSYGSDLTFTTMAAPTVTTDAATAVGSGVGTPNGTLDDDGGEVCDCGFEWGETVAYGNTTPTQSRETGQTFSQELAGLLPSTTYHFRAFATNAAGTSYGADRVFTTDPPNPGIIIPTVATNPETNILQRFATFNGDLDDDGGEHCACGFEWGETIAYGNTTPIQTKATGQSFSQIISGLIPNTTYHFRAFATNSAGTGYGADRAFTTQQEPIVISKAYSLAREEL